MVWLSSPNDSSWEDGFLFCVNPLLEEIGSVNYRIKMSDFNHLHKMFLSWSKCGCTILVTKLRVKDHTHIAGGMLDIGGQVSKIAF